MTTRNLLAGTITLSAAKINSRNILCSLGFVDQKQKFYERIEGHRELLSEVIAHHLGTDAAVVTISGQEYWRHGSFNLCIPVHVDIAATPALPQFVIIRFPLPYRVGEAAFPGNSDEKISCEAATYAWLQENCPSVPIPGLYGFGLSNNRQFTSVEFLPWWSRWFQHARRSLLAVCGLQQPSQYVPHSSARFANLDIGYMLIETIHTEVALSESWDKKYEEPKLRENLLRDLARIMLTLAQTPLPRIGSFRLDHDGYLRLDNRVISVQSAVQENEGIPVNTHRRQTFDRVDDFIRYHIEAFDTRLVHQPNGITSQDDAYFQMTSLAAAKIIFPPLFDRELNTGPFVLSLTDLHRSNIIVDDEWNIVCIIDLEFAYSQPIEFLQPPYWLDGRAMDEIDAESYAPYHAEFLQHVKQQEKLLPGLPGTAPVSSLMQQAWASGAFWATLAMESPVAFTEIFYNRILANHFSFSRDALSTADYGFFARFWRRDVPEVVEEKLKDYNKYTEKLDLIFKEPS